MITPESSTPTTPENPSVSPLEGALRFAAVDGLWQQTKDIYYTHHTKENSYTPDDADLYNAEVAGAVAEYLRSHGLDETSDEAVRLGSRLRMLAFDRMNTKRWKSGDWKDRSDHTKGLKPGTSGEARVRKLQMALTGRDLEEEASVAAREPEATTPETEDSPERLTELRQAKYDAFVARMKGPAFGRRKRELQEAYETAELSYMTALGVKNKRDIEAKQAELAASGKTDDEIKSELRLFAKQEAENTNKEDQETQHRLLVERSGRMGRFLEWYGNRSTLGKVALGVGLSGAAIASGVGIGFLAGAFGGLVGAGIATGVGAGLTRAWGAARTYQLRLAELYRHPTHREKLEFSDTDTADALHLRQRAFLEATSRNQLQNGERVKKRAVWWALGTTAVGGALGVASHMFADGWSPAHLPGGQAQHELANRGVRAPWDADRQSSGSKMPIDIEKDRPPVKLDGVQEPSSEHGAPVPEKAPDIDDHLFVDEGHGLIKEMRESAIVAGYKIDGKTAEELYGAVREKFGDNGIIDIENIKKDTYLYHGDLRLSGPGRAIWKDGVTDFMEKWLNDHGHGANVVSKVAFAGDAANHSSSGITESIAADHFSRIHEANVSLADPAADHFTRIQEANASLAHADASADHFTRTNSGSGVDTAVDASADHFTRTATGSGVDTSVDASADHFSRVAEGANASSEMNAQMLKDLGANVAPTGTTTAEINLQTLKDLGASLDAQDHITAPSALDQAIGQGNALPMNVVEHGENWGKTFDELRQAGIVDIPKGQYDSFLRQVGPELAKLKYDDGTPVAYFDRVAHDWRMYDAPHGILLPDALKLITQFADRDGYELAS